jgi:hypothetical protein
MAAKRYWSQMGTAWSEEGPERVRRGRGERMLPALLCLHCDGELFRPFLAYGRVTDILVGNIA